jgi:hypothetical protein
MLMSKAVLDYVVDEPHPRHAAKAARTKELVEFGIPLLRVAQPLLG